MRHLTIALALLVGLACASPSTGPIEPPPAAIHGEWEWEGLRLFVGQNGSALTGGGSYVPPSGPQCPVTISGSYFQTAVPAGATTINLNGGILCGATIEGTAAGDRISGTLTLHYTNPLPGSTTKTIRARITLVRQ